jgi:hypothetical protein
VNGEQEKPNFTTGGVTLQIKSLLNPPEIRTHLRNFGIIGGTLPL